jgi:hypothetical protein
VSNTTNARNGLQQKLGHEMKQFVIIFLYLALLIGARQEDSLPIIVCLAFSLYVFSTWLLFTSAPSLARYH